jgi:hypothetical protein
MDDAAQTHDEETTSIGTGSGGERLRHPSETRYAWNYGSEATSVRELYGRAKAAQWNGATDLPWETDVDPEGPAFPDMIVPVYGSAIWDALSTREQRALKTEIAAWMISQFLHGEQGALLATSQLVDAVPGLDAKLYGATQVLDEARHVEVYARYLRDKMGMEYPVSRYLKRLLDQVLTDARWDMKFLGMQIMVEGLALAAFRFIHSSTEEPLLRKLTHAVMRDEARHVAFGVLALRDVYGTMDPRAFAEREDFVIEASRLMHDRFLAHDVWERVGLPVAECCEHTLRSPTMVAFRAMLFATIVPNVRRLGLLTPRVRAAMEELGVLAYEHDDPADVALDGAA